MTEFQPFVMERMMSKWENVVDYNLSESGANLYEKDAEDIRPGSPNKRKIEAPTSSASFS